jgi:hypothetical protein
MWRFLVFLNFFFFFLPFLLLSRSFSFRVCGTLALCFAIASSTLAAGFSTSCLSERRMDVPTNASFWARPTRRCRSLKRFSIRFVLDFECKTTICSVTTATTLRMSAACFWWANPFLRTFWICPIALSPLHSDRCFGLKSKRIVCPKSRCCERFSWLSFFSTCKKEYAGMDAEITRNSNPHAALHVPLFVQGKPIAFSTGSLDKAVERLGQVIVFFFFFCFCVFPFFFFFSPLSYQRLFENKVFLCC